MEYKVDITLRVNPDMIPESIPLDEVQYATNYLVLYYLVFNLSQPPMDDLRVRKALAHAIDRKMILEISAGQKQLYATGGVILPEMAGYSPELGLKHDVERAKQYMADAGFPDGHHFPKLNLKVPPESPITVEILREWQDGLGIEAIPFERESSDEALMEADFHAIGGGWVADYPDPDSMLRLLVTYGLGPTGWHNTHFNELVECAAHTSDRAQRLAMYREADRIIVMEDVLIVPLGYGGVLDLPSLKKPWLKNFRSNALGYFSHKDGIIEPH